MITLIGVFLLQFLMKFADKLVGKGLDAWIIFKLIAFNLSWMFVLVVPMSTLVATLMAFGNMSQNNEVTIIKSSGTSLYKMLLAPFITSIIVAFLLFEFNNEILPDANHQAKILMQDISNKKPTLSLEPGFFSQEVPSYAILVRKIDQQTNKLYEVTIYDYTNPAKINVVTAKEGIIYFSKDQRRLLMDLQDGEIHESDVQNTGAYRKLEFDQHRITMRADQFSLQESAPYTRRGEREMSVETMGVIIDSLETEKVSINKNLETESSKYLFADTSVVLNFQRSDIEKSIDLVLIRVREKVTNSKNVLLSNINRVQEKNRSIERYEVEVHKKYALPVACIVFILIGAPLGIMVRKGGFGVAASISLFFFLVYWAFLIGGEKLAERGFFSPFIGMWAANILLAVIGIFITIKTNQETVTIEFKFLKKLVPKKFRNKENVEPENN